MRSIRLLTTLAVVASAHQLHRPPSLSLGKHVHEKQKPLADSKRRSLSSSHAKETFEVNENSRSTCVSAMRGGALHNDAEAASSFFQMTPLALAALSISTSMSLHYLAYSLARPATMTLFTSSRLGFGNSRSAYPFAMTFISPMSLVLLLGYGAVLGKLGPLSALKATTLGCSSVLLVSGLLIAKLDGMVESHATAKIITKYLIGTLFVFRESYVQLITSQHWSFLSSILTPNQSSRWFAPISGLTSVTSAAAAMAVGRLSQILGLSGVLVVAGLVLGVSLILGDVAYGIAQKVSVWGECWMWSICCAVDTFMCRI